MDWIYLGQETDKWRVVVNSVMNFRASRKQGISWLNGEIFASEEQLCWTELTSSIRQQRFWLLLLFESK